MNINKNRVLVFILIFIVTMFLISGIKCVNAASDDIERVNSIDGGYIKSITGNERYRAYDTWKRPQVAPTDYLLKYYVRKIYEIGNDNLINQNLPSTDIDAHDVMPGQRIGSVGGTKGKFNYNATVQSDNAGAWRRWMVQNDML